MKRLLFSIQAAIFLVVPARAQDNDNRAGPNDNKAPEGFTLLFNGKDRDGWQGQIDMNERSAFGAGRLKFLVEERNKAAADTWIVNDGLLEFAAKKDRFGRPVGCNLQTVKDCGDFELHADWRIDPGTDAGLFLRGTPRVRLWDSDRPAPQFKDLIKTGSGGLAANPDDAPGYKPEKKADNPVGEWNHIEIEMRADKVSVVLNKISVLKSAPLAVYWDKKKPLPATGPIELVMPVGGKIGFKNVYIKELK